MSRTETDPPVFWWVSWEEHDSPNDSRPIHDPPGPNVIAWWESGVAGDGSYVTMVALVVSPTEGGIEEVLKPDWPSKKPRVWRFRNLLTERPLHIGDRFPLSEWSERRLQHFGVSYDGTRRQSPPLPSGS